MDCIFCKIVSGEVPSYKIYEDENFLAFLDINPINAGHTLLIPKKHTVNIFDSDDNLNMLIYPLLKKLATILKECINCDGVNILQSNGEAAGQVVFHSHIHLIPRFANDGKAFDSASIRKSISNEILSSYAKLIKERADLQK